LGHLSSVQRNAKHNGQLKKDIINCGDFFFKSPKYFYFLGRTAFANNDLHASDGRDTEALNCKPITNLKEISELSNYSKTSGFRLHAVIG
jgi:hypothetical protein